MRDLIWIAAVAAVLVAGWFFMARLDGLIERSCGQREPEEAGLRLGVERGLDAGALCGMLGEVRLFTGTEQELRRELAEGRLDVILLRTGEACGAVLLWRGAE